MLLYTNTLCCCPHLLQGAKASLMIDILYLLFVEFLSSFTPPAFPPLPSTCKNMQFFRLSFPSESNVEGRAYVEASGVIVFAAGGEGRASVE
jgi:hypothetical protein